MKNNDKNEIKYKNAFLAMKYRPEAEAAYNKLINTPKDFKIKFLELLENNPKGPADEYLEVVKAEYNRWLKPYDNTRANIVLQEARKLGDQVEHEFREAINLLGDSADPIDILAKIKNRHYSAKSIPDSAETINSDGAVFHFGKSSDRGTSKVWRSGSSKFRFFSKLANGDFGLAKTFWLFDVLVNFVASVGGILIKSNKLLVAFTIALILYFTPVLMGVWRASRSYEGPAVWALLAKIHVILSWALLVILAFLVVGLAFDPPNSMDIDQKVQPLQKESYSMEYPTPKFVNESIGSRENSNIRRSDSLKTEVLKKQAGSESVFEFSQQPNTEKSFNQNLNNRNRNYYRRSKIEPPSDGDLGTSTSAEENLLIIDNLINSKSTMSGYE